VDDVDDSTFTIPSWFSPSRIFRWCLFSKACSLLCHAHIRDADVQEADKLLLEFCEGFQNLYGKDECTPNMHMHCRLSDYIMDVGPLHSFWCFSFERYNGILEKMQKSWQAPEIQLIHKFTSLQTLVSIELAYKHWCPLNFHQVFHRFFYNVSHK